MKSIILLTLLSVYAAYTHAQEVARFYQVEIIVFKQIEADSAINKIKDVSHSQTSQDDERAALDLFKTDTDHKMQAVATNRLRLSAEARKIELDSRYELLYHGAWRQPPYHRTQAPLIKLLDEPQNGLLKGTAWMSYERYFRLLLNFQYDPDFARTAEVVDTPQAFSIPIHLERTMSDNELFYIDHTIIGVIALISPIN